MGIIIQQLTELQLLYNFRAIRIIKHVRNYLTVPVQFSSQNAILNT